MKCEGKGEWIPVSGAETVEMIASLMGGFGVIFGVYTYYKDSRRKTQKATMDAYKELQQNVLVHINQWKPSEIAETAKNKSLQEYKTLSEYLAEIEHF